MLQLTTILFLIAGSIFTVVHYLAEQLFLYWRFWWFDLPMHFLGGIVIALAMFTLFDLHILKSKSWVSLGRIMVVVLLVALSWEAYEYLTDAVQVAGNYALDTTLDIIMGLLGGYIGYLVGRNIRNIR